MNSEFIDTSEECIKMLKKLTRQALNKAGKELKPKIVDSLPSRSGSIKKSIGYRCSIDKDDNEFNGYPVLFIGYRKFTETRKKEGIKRLSNPYWLEFGFGPHIVMTKMLKYDGYSNYELTNGKGALFGVSNQNPGTPAKNYLRNTAFANINEINAAMEDKLKELTDYEIKQGMVIEEEGDIEG